MGIGTRFFKNAVRGVYTRLMDKVGGRFVAGIADTSADAPDSYYTPKRDRYAQMVAEEEARKKGESTA